MSAESSDSISPSDSPRPLKGKRALISGASRGIGRGIALEMAQAGALVTINYHSNPEEADSVVKECEALGVAAFAIGADISDADQVRGMVSDACEQMGGLDIVVSNAAYSDRHLMLESDMDEFRRTIDVSMWAPFIWFDRVPKRWSTVAMAATLSLSAVLTLTCRCLGRWRTTWPRLRTIRWRERPRWNSHRNVFV